MEQARFRKLLRTNNLSATKPRSHLFRTLRLHPALTMKQLIKLLGRDDQVTTYRNVALFEKLGIIDRVRLGWQTKIELSDLFRRHHHHFSCINCGRVIDLPENPIIEEQIRWLAATNRLKAVDHQLEIRGLCPACQKLRT